MWFPERAAECAIRTRMLLDMGPYLAFKLSVTRAEECHNTDSDSISIALRLLEGLYNYCVFHEHLFYGEEKCRKRIGHKAHVFAALISACIQHDLGITRENDEQ